MPEQNLNGTADPKSIPDSSSAKTNQPIVKPAMNEASSATLKNSKLEQEIKRKLRAQKLQILRASYKKTRDKKTTEKTIKIPVPGKITPGEGVETPSSTEPEPSPKASEKKPAGEEVPKHDTSTAESKGAPDREETEKKPTAEQAGDRTPSETPSSTEPEPSPKASEKKPAGEEVPKHDTSTAESKGAPDREETEKKPTAEQAGDRTPSETPSSTEPEPSPKASEKKPAEQKKKEDDKKTRDKKEAEKARELSFRRRLAIKGLRAGEKRAGGKVGKNLGTAAQLLEEGASVKNLTNLLLIAAFATSPIPGEDIIGFIYIHLHLILSYFMPNQFRKFTAIEWAGLALFYLIVILIVLAIYVVIALIIEEYTTLI